MFKFLKEKLGKALSAFSKKVESEGEVRQVEALSEELGAAKDSGAEDVSKPLVWLGQPIGEPDAEPSSEAVSLENDGMRRVFKLQSLEAEGKGEPDKTALEKPQIERAEKPLIKKHEGLWQAAKVEDERFASDLASGMPEESAPSATVVEELQGKDSVSEKDHGSNDDLPNKQEPAILTKASAEKIVSQSAGKARQPKHGFFKRLFGKKDDEWGKVDRHSMVLEQDAFENVKEDYSFKEEESVEFTNDKELLASNGIKISDSSKELESATVVKKGLFEKVKESLTTVRISNERFNDLFWDVELGMLENNVAVEVVEKIKTDLRSDLTSGRVARSNVEVIIHDSLKRSIDDLFSESIGYDLIDRVKSAKKPFVIAFIGVNGSGKTTTMAKVAHLLLKSNFSVVFAASDTFRAAAIQQLQEHANRLGVKIIKHDYESDPAAVAFDAIRHAEAKSIDVVLIDTAGRLHTNDNLMNELKKLVRVNKPDLKVFVGESITGNDCVEQAKLFDEAVGIDAVILAKADVDEKGGAAISISFVTKKPILYLGTGQGYDDLTRFDKSLIIKNIGL